MIEEADAWFEYLEATRAQSETRYREIEPWAWARLMQRMRAIKTRRAKLRGDGSRRHRACACPHTRRRPVQATPLREAAREAHAQGRAGRARRRAWRRAPAGAREGRSRAGGP